ncbi:tRNA pseudouridine(55) synthase TruB [Bifidobacterium dolichotidis]|nr:tRNA pseudouridine(55) synthase TruB [Bifidobacterium dolichotidis]
MEQTPHNAAASTPARNAVASSSARKADASTPALNAVASTSVRKAVTSSSARKADVQTPARKADALSVAALPAAGVVVVDKPQGVTSHDIVAMMRHALHTKKVGHAGTLDPMATGVLVIGYGDCTKLLNVIVEHSKTYAATIRFGQATTTDDAEGEVTSSVASADELPTLDAVRQCIADHFVGDIEQVPNTYSAIKVHGRRAYDLAREGKEVHLEARPITIRAFDVLASRETQSADGTPVLDVDVQVTCSAGTYIRALARDLGEALHCGAHLVMLRRLAVGEYTLDDTAHVVHAYTEVHEFTNREGQTMSRQRARVDAADEQRLPELVIPMAQAVRQALPVLDITEEQATQLRHGQWLDQPLNVPLAAAITAGNDVVALVEPARGKHTKPQTVFAAIQ